MRPKFHYTAKKNWINDPNGLMYFKGKYHMYYQHNPENEYWGNMTWGHATSDDLFNWLEHDLFLKADRKEDIDGCFSGSAFVKDDTIHYAYTGVRFWERMMNERGNFVPKNHEDMIPTQLFAKSEDGFKVEKVLGNEMEPHDDISPNDYRDPKIFEKNGQFFMIIGARKGDAGGVILYRSNNLYDWERIDDFFTEDYGFMWECPDYLTFEEGDVLLYSAMGLKDLDGNLTYVSGYSGASMDNLSIGPFNYLDYSEKFYAPQTFDTKDDRNIMLGWVRMEEPVDGTWTGMMSIPRELTYKGGTLYQLPVDELKAYRVFSEKVECKGSFGITISEDQSLDIELNELMGSLAINLSDTSSIVVESNGEKVSVFVKFSDRDKTYRFDEALKNIRIIKDAQVAEIFINNGKFAITEVYGESIDDYRLMVNGDRCNMTIHVLEKGD